MLVRQVLEQNLRNPMSPTQANNRPSQGQVLQFPSNATYLRDRHVAGGPPSGGGSLPPADGGGVEPPSGTNPVNDVTGLKINVRILNGAATLAASAIIGLYFLLSSQIDNRFDKAEDKIGRVSEQVTEIRVIIEGQGRDVKAALDKVDNENKSRKTDQ